jgi:hypothetical protein
MGTYLERINGIAEQLQAEIREQYNEPEATVQAFDVDALGGNALTTQSTANVISLLCSVPNGVQAMSQDIPGLVQTSLNLGIAKLGDRFSLTFSVRSSVNAEKVELLEKLKGIIEMHNGSYSTMGDYPAWEYKKDSNLRDTMVKIYTEMFHNLPQFRIGHINSVIEILTIAALAVLKGIFPRPLCRCFWIYAKTPVSKLENQDITPSPQPEPYEPTLPCRCPFLQRTG